MPDERNQTPLSEQQLERLLSNAPASSPRLPDQRRQAIWRHIEAHLESHTPAAKVLPARRAPRSRQRIAWAVAALFVVALGLAALSRFGVRSSSPPVAVEAPQSIVGTVEEVHGTCTATFKGKQKALSQGAFIVAGEMLLAPRGASMRVKLEDQSMVWLSQNTQLLCVGARSASQPVMDVQRGEVHVQASHSKEIPFTLNTSAACLRVLGTQFSCRVYPAIGQENAPMQSNRSILSKALVPAVVVSVISGAVSVQTSQAEQVVRAGQRTQVSSGGAPSPVQQLASPQFRPDAASPTADAPAPESLLIVPVRSNLLHQLWAINLENSQGRHVADFVGCAPQVGQRLGENYAIVDSSQLIFAHFGDEPLSNSGRPLAGEQLFLTNLQSGETVPMVALKDYDPLYSELSPDRRKVAFCGSRKNPDGKPGQWGLYVLDLETNQIKLLMDRAVKTAPHWSPDSRFLAVSKGEDYTTNHQIVLVDTISGETLETPFMGAGAAFSPDGKQLAFSAGFKRGGTWMAGVPAWGNLFLAPLPPSQTQDQLTSLPMGGAIFPRFSPDGSRLAYWDCSKSGDSQELHVIDLATRRDLPVTQGSAFGELLWVDANSRLMLSPGISKKKYESQGAGVKLITLEGDKAQVRLVTPSIPEMTPEEKAASKAFAEQLYQVFVYYAQAIQAKDLHKGEEAQAHFVEARDLLQKITDEVSSASQAGKRSAAVPASYVSVENLEPYLELMKKEAGKGVSERNVETVRENLEYYLPPLLRLYYEQNSKLPVSPTELLKFALANQWRTNHIDASDTDKVRGLFVVPGEEPGTKDNPQEPRSSYELVSTDETAGTWVIRTPALANGKRLEASYRIDKNTKQPFPKVEIREVP